MEKIITLTKRQYCIIKNPIEGGVPQFGKRKLVQGPANFFIQPGEVLEENKIREGKAPTIANFFFNVTLKFSFFLFSLFFPFSFFSFSHSVDG